MQIDAIKTNALEEFCLCSRAVCPSKRRFPSLSRGCCTKVYFSLRNINVSGRKYPGINDGIQFASGTCVKRESPEDEHRYVKPVDMQLMKVKKGDKSSFMQMNLS